MFVIPLTTPVRLVAVVDKSSLTEMRRSLVTLRAICGYAYYPSFDTVGVVLRFRFHLQSANTSLAVSFLGSLYTELGFTLSLRHGD